MNFLYPAILFLGLCVAIPVLIHLFHFRKVKSVYFSKVDLLKYVDIQQNKSSKIKHWLMLILRILIVIFLALAFSQPYWKSSKSLLNPAFSHTVGVIIDNSFSMERASLEGRAFDQAKAMAVETLLSYSERDRFHVVSSDPGEFTAAILTQSEAIEKILSLTLSSAATDIAIPIQLQNDIFKSTSKSPCIQYVFSDFSKQSTSLSKINLDSSVTLVPVRIQTHPTPNMAIDSVFVSEPLCVVGQSVELSVVIQNHGLQDYSETPLRLYLNDKLVGVKHINLGAGEVLTQHFTIPIPDTNEILGRVSIEDYPVVFDDVRYFNLKGTHQRPLLEIYQEHPNPYMMRLYTQDALWKFSSTALSSLNYANIADYPVIILSELRTIPTGLSAALLDAFNNGAILIIFPADVIDYKTYNDFLGTLCAMSYDSIRKQDLEIEPIEVKHPLWNHVFHSLPKQWETPHIKDHYPIKASQHSPLTSIINLANGDPLLVQYRKDDAVVYLWALPLNEQASDLPSQPLIVPLLTNMTLQSQQQNLLYRTAGDPIPYTLRLGDLGREVPRLIAIKDDQAWIPRWQSQGGTLRLFLQGLPLEAGHYRIQAGSGAVVSINYNQSESSTDDFSTLELVTILKNQGIDQPIVVEGQKEKLHKALNQSSGNWPLWKWAILLTLSFLLLELVLRIDKNTISRLKWRKKN